MKVSAAIEVVWQLAGQEAVAGEFKEIEPEHFLMGVLKLGELPVKDADSGGSDSDPVRELANAAKTIREALAGRALDGQRLRRELRRRLGKGGCPHDGGKLHRSQTSRSLVDSAVRFAAEAGDEVLLPLHLLQAVFATPTPVMAELLGEAAKSGAPGQQDALKQTPTPLLDECGQDLIARAKAGELTADPVRQAECLVLLGLFSRRERKSVLLVSANAQSVQGVVASLACVLAGTHSISMAAVPRGRRLIDLSSLRPLGRSSGDAVAEFERLLAESAASQELILVTPPLERTAASKDASCAWTDRLISILMSGTPQCLCHTTPASLEGIMHDTPSLRRLVHIMYVEADPVTAFPNEL